MNIRRSIEKRIRERLGGVEAQGDAHVVVAANVGEDGAVTAVSSTSEATAGGHEEPEREERP